MLHTDTVVVGAGQAGLATSRLLVEAGRDHVVLERGRIGERWRSERWDSLRLLTPNWMTRLPHHVYDGDDPDGYMRAGELAERFAGYAASFDAPVHEEVAVRSVEPHDRGYVVETTAGRWSAANVVVATGWFSEPVVPPVAAALDRRVHQVHAARYRNPTSLPHGGVLVVGASSSGVQIAEELARAGRDVTVAVGSHARLPRRYRDRDVLWWLDRVGVLDDPPVDDERARRQPSLQIAGRPAEAGLDVLARLGVRVTGRLVGGAGQRVAFADDLHASVAAADRRMLRLLDRVDACCGGTGDRPSPLVLPVAPRHGHLAAEGIRSVVWATGLRPAFPWLHVPVLDADGALVHRRGVTAFPGLYGVGMRWQTRRSSTFVDGVRHDARAVVRHLLDRRSAAAA